MTQVKLLSVSGMSVAEAYIKQIAPMQTMITTKLGFEIQRIQLSSLLNGIKVEFIWELIIDLFYIEK